MQALWHFRFRWQRRPHLLRSLEVSPDAAVAASTHVTVSGAASGRRSGHPDTARTSARWEDPAARGATVVGIIELPARTGHGDDAVPALVEWPVQAQAPGRGDSLVAVIHGFTLSVRDHPAGVAVSRLAMWAGVPDASGRFGAGVLLGARHGLEIEASLSLAVLAVPEGALAITAPGTAEVQPGGFATVHPPIAARVSDDPAAPVRPLGFAALEWDLAGGRPSGRRTARPLRDLGVTMSGLVVRWHLSAAGMLTRPALVGANATIPCIRLR